MGSIFIVHYLDYCVYSVKRKVTMIRSALILLNAYNAMQMPGIEPTSLKYHGQFLFTKFIWWRGCLRRSPRVVGPECGY